MSSTILRRQEKEISALISELNSLGASASNYKANSKIDRPLLPKLSHWYRIGVILYSSSSSSSSRGDQNQQQHPPPIVQMLESYQQLVSFLPASYLESCFATLQKALDVLLAKTTTTTSKNTNTSTTTTTTAPSDFASLSEAIQSLVGLLAHSKRACQLAYSHELLASLASIYDHCLRLESSSSSSNECAQLETSKRVSLQCLSHLLLDGLIFRFTDSHKSNANQPKQQPQPLEHQFMQALQTIEEQSTECMGDLLAWQDAWEHQQEQELRLEVALRGCYKAGTDSTQLDYVLQMLETARRDYNTRQQKRLPVGHGGGTTSSSKPAPTTTKMLKPVSATDELDRRIDQVHTLLPDLGAGFIETALSHYQGNVETTVSMLFGDSSLLPPALRVIDRHLPRRKKANSNKQEEEELAAEAKQVVKDRMALERKQEEERYRALLYVAQKEEQEQRHQNVQQQGGQEGSAIVATTYHGEYDDDYDDQYDDMEDGGLGGADSGWYDTGGNNDTTSDYDKVRLYNQVARHEEAEGAFWEENRNTNRLGSNKNDKGKNGNIGGADDDDEGGAAGNKFRGPDKIKGGRVIGPDGKVVKNNRFGKQQQQQQKAAAVGASQPQQQQQGKKVNSNINNNTAAASGTGGPTQPPKPRTKPKSNNRVQRQRDKKQQKQGTFGESAS
jgi:hypothetical protein